MGPPSAEHGRYRDEVHSALQSLLAYSAAPGTAGAYGATLRAIMPKGSAMLSSCALPMESEGVLYACFVAALLLGPKSPSAVTGQSAVRRSYVVLATAAVAFRHVVRGKRAIFGDEWPPRMGVFWNGIKRSCVHATPGKLPLLSAEMRAVRIRGKSALARLRPEVARKDLPLVGCGPGSF